jgi:hypothetical protein
MSSDKATLEPFLKHSRRFLDYEVVSAPKCVPADIRSHWFASSDFALHFAFPPAQRLWVREDQDGTVQHAYYYNEDWSRAGKRITVFGPAELDVDEAREMLQVRNAVRLDVRGMPAASLSAQQKMETWTITSSGEDVIVKMPSTVEELLSSFGSNKRQQLGKYTRRLERQWPGGVEWICLERGEITQELFETVLALNSKRQAAKGKQSSWNHAVAEQRWKLAARTGLIVGLRLGGEFAAGGLAYLYGEDAYFSVIGHEPKFDYWNLGNLITWLMMRKSLERGARRFHFLWGLSEYKLRFGGEIQPLYTVTVFRNSRARFIFSLLEFPSQCRGTLLGFAQSTRLILRNAGFGQRIYPVLHRLFLRLRTFFGSERRMSRT